MEKLYKNHRITVLGWLDHDGWLVSVFITYHSGDKNMLVTFPMNEKFTTYSGAIVAGFAAAEKWIDKGSEP